MCKTCVAYENMSKKASEQEAYFKNVKRKEESCAEKAKDKERASLLTYNNSKVTTSLTFSETHISGDRKHDYHAVHHFFPHGITHLATVHHFKCVCFNQFSDGCASQYKSKGPFLDRSNNDTLTEHHYYAN